MLRRWSALGVAVSAALLLVALVMPASAVPIGPYPSVTFPAAPAETVEPGVWDLTAGPVTVSYTLDLGGAPNVAFTGNYDHAGLVGLFGGGAGARMMGFLADQSNSGVKFPTYGPGNASDLTQTIHDKFNMQRFPNPEPWDETLYDTNCTTGIVGSAIGSGSNHGIWFDRDGVDSTQAGMWGMVNGDTYNTLGVYDVVLTFDQAATPGYGFACATVNGRPTGFYTSWVPTGPQLSPYGLSFEATPEQMEAMQVVVSGASDDGAVTISNLTVDGTPAYTTADDCLEGEFFVSSQGAMETEAVVPGHKYLVKARGTYFANGTFLYDIQGDAEYSEDTYQRINGLPWTHDVRGYTDYGDVLLDLTIDGQNVDWGAYSPTHEYSLEMVAGTSTLDFAFSVYDIAYNNVGGLCVSVTDLGNIGAFEGFFSPVDNPPTPNLAKAGQAIPLKWRLLDYNGVPVSDLAAVKVVATTMDCDAGTTADQLEEVAGGSSGLQYLGDGYWQFNWKTPKSYANSCKTMTLTLLGDGSTHSAYFTFK